jgi:antitoxin component YwqK of YwqJK toxin-antitoxin module
MKLIVNYIGIVLIIGSLFIIVSSFYSVNPTTQKVVISRFEKYKYTVVTKYSDSLLNNKQSLCWEPNGSISNVALKDSNLSYHVYKEEQISVLGQESVTFFNYTKSWFKNGSVSEQIVFSNDEFAIKEYYYKHGSIKKRGGFRHNRKQGVWSYWKESGEIVKRQLWNNGELLSSSLN